MTCSLVKRGIFMMLHLLKFWLLMLIKIAQRFLYDTFTYVGSWIFHILKAQPFSSLMVQYLARIWFTDSV